MGPERNIIVRENRVTWVFFDPGLSPAFIKGPHPVFLQGLQGKRCREIQTVVLVVSVNVFGNPYLEIRAVHSAVQGGS